ncbi:MAG: hypothetical protein M3R65_10300 [Gemmatimonadota bacterium]|nr:hypothetical protein [Gemmatimonadota bacterium]
MVLKLIPSSGNTPPLQRERFFQSLLKASSSRLVHRSRLAYEPPERTLRVSVDRLRISGLELSAPRHVLSFREIAEHVFSLLPLVYHWQRCTGVSSPNPLRTTTWRR